GGMAPQQRRLLEVTWEAREHAGQPTAELRDRPTGVFVGIGGSDYLQLRQRAADLGQIDVYSGTGTGASFAAGRIAHLLGARGPCLALDTACSSSLVALHLAARSLQAGECSLALVGGVNLILSPAGSIYFARL